MRANEFLKENASSGATAAGNVATVVQPQRSGGSFFGGDMNASIYSNNPLAIIRRVGPTAESNKNKKKGRKKAGD